MGGEDGQQAEIYTVCRKKRPKRFYNISYNTWAILMNLVEGFLNIFAAK